MADFSPDRRGSGHSHHSKHKSRGDRRSEDSPSSSDTDSGTSSSNGESSSGSVVNTSGLKRSRNLEGVRSRKRKHRKGGLNSSSDDLYESSLHRNKSRKEKYHKKDKVKHKEMASRHKQKRHKHKEKSNEEGAGPVQLSKFLGRTKDDGVRRSAVSGKKIQMKVEKSKEDKLAESKRNELLKFLNASYD